MQITEIRIKLLENTSSRQRLCAFCSIILDDAFVVRDIKILSGNQGYFIAMPSRKLAFHGPHCRQKNSIGANFCSHCGGRIAQSDPYRDLLTTCPNKAFVDVAHPINAASRDRVHHAIIEAYEAELERSRRPNYVSSYQEYGDD